MSRPPLRWVGGKQRYSRKVSSYLEVPRGQRGLYFEPFLGGGSVFWAVRPHEGVLGDLNKDLIEFYRYLSEAPEELWNSVKAIGQDVNADTYYPARDEFNGEATGLRRAALFLLLNRCGFNGIWRVNRKGQYNVPFGGRSLCLPDLNEWLDFAKTLSGMIL